AADPFELRLVEHAVVARVVHADRIEDDEMDAPAVEGGVARPFPLLVERLAVAGLRDRRVAPAAVDAEYVVVADGGPHGHGRPGGHLVVRVVAGAGGGAVGAKG